MDHRLYCRAVNKLLTVAEESKFILEFQCLLSDFREDWKPLNNFMESHGDDSVICFNMDDKETNDLQRVAQAFSRQGLRVEFQEHTETFL